MSVQPPGDNPELYCTADDVAEFFDKYEDGFTTSTNPSKSEVESRIAAASNWVDDYTGHAWRERQVAEEFHHLDGPYSHRSGTPISLNKRDIRTPLDSTKGDKLEFWSGNEYDDFVSSSDFKEGRGEDYWFDSSDGVLYVYRRYAFWERHKEIRITYRYGQDTVPQTIRDATARRAASFLLETQQYRVTTPGNDDSPPADQVAERWRELCKDDLKPYVEVRSTGL